jgi:hypothetical protein
MARGLTYVKVWGRKRSGTNLARYLLEQNFRRVRVLADVLGWKHARPTLVASWDVRDWYPEASGLGRSPLSDDELEDVRLAHEAGEIAHLMMIKEPYAWLVSSLRWRGPGLSAADPKLIRARLKNWMSFARAAVEFEDLCEKIGRKALVVKCETIAQSLWLVGEYFGLERSRFDMNLPSRKLKPTGDLRSGDAMMSAEPYDPDYYSQFRYMQHYSTKQVLFVGSVLADMDPQIMERLGYRASMTV